MLLLVLQWFSLRENGTSYVFTLLMVSSPFILDIYSLAAKSGGQDFLLKILKASTSLHSLPSDLWYLLSEDANRDPEFRSKDRSFLAFSIFFFSLLAINCWSFWDQLSFFVVWLWFYSCFLLSCSSFLLTNHPSSSLAGCWMIDQFSAYLCVNLWLPISHEGPYSYRHLTFNDTDLYIIYSGFRNPAVLSQPNGKENNFDIHLGHDSSHPTLSF